MRVELASVPLSEKMILWEHLQRYCAELMPFGNFAPVNGVFEYEWFDLYWQEPNRFPFWALAEGDRAAFALVRCEERTEMAEFYTFPRFRRTGVGLDFARQILERFPGRWEISQYRAHIGAVTFWHTAIAPYPFKERVYVGGEGKERLEQTFVVP